MKSEPIICQGNELSKRLSEIRSRGGFVYAMDTMVGSNAGYALHVNFGRVEELAPHVAGRQKRCRDILPAGENPASPVPSADSPAQCALFERDSDGGRDSVYD